MCREFCPCHSVCEPSFAPGYDPALELAQRSYEQKSALTDVGTNGQEEWADLPNDGTKCLRRKEQDLVDRIVKGTESGRYYIFIGCKVNCNPSRIRIALLTRGWVGCRQDYYDI